MAPPTVDPIANARAIGRNALNENNGKHLLAQFHLPVPKGAVVADQFGVDAAIATLSPPFVVKVMSLEILHKSDFGGVRINLPDVAAVKEAIGFMADAPAIRDNNIDGYLIEEMAPRGQEIVIGGVLEPQFGPMIMVGLGGVFVEILADVAFRLCPITKQDARAMLNELRGGAMLDGARGEPAVSRDAIVDALLQIGGDGGLLMTHGEDIAELDINPLIVSQNGAVAVDARVLLTSNASATRDVAPLKIKDPADYFAPLFAPKTIAIVGASSSSVNIGNTFIDRLRETGFTGDIYPIHPSADSISDLPAYPSLGETPNPIDYAYIAVGANRVPPMLSDAKGRVGFAQVISAGFGEVEQGVALESDLVSAARDGGCRVIGPNCLGLHTPRGRVGFAKNASMELGSIGVISQSGGLGTDIVKRGQNRGLKFSGLVTVGNSADLGPNDILEFYLSDAQTKVIGMYLEDVKDGRRFASILRNTKSTKPVVILKGGRTRQGQRAAASHTGSLAGDDRVWDALSQQTGCILVDTLDQFLEALLAFQYLTPRNDRPTQRVVLFGNGGGTSVLATDFFAQRELNIDPLDDQALHALAALDLPPGTSVVNPIDTPVITLQAQEGRIAGAILDAVYTTSTPDAVVMHLNLASFLGRGPIDPLDNLIHAAVNVQTQFPGQAHFMLVLRSDGEPSLEESKRMYRTRALEAGIPVYDELSNAAMALTAIRHVENFLKSAGTD
jgi:acyl-CoA synthetase (NDP forming)